MLAEVFSRDGSKNRRQRVLKRYVLKPFMKAIEMDIYAEAQLNPSMRAKMRLEAKKMAMETLTSVIPFYIEAGGDIKSFHSDIVNMVVDRENIGTIANRAYWSRMATDAWRGWERDNER